MGFLHGSRIEALKRDGVITLGGCTMDRARKDLKKMDTGQNLCIPPISHTRYDENVLRDAVMFILSKDNVSTISCGRRKLNLLMKRQSLCTSQVTKTHI